MLVDGETGAFVEFNERAHKNLGYTREEFAKIKISDFEVFESEEKIAKHIKKVIKERADSFETKHRTKEGEIRDIHVNSRAISILGKDFTQSISRDITDRKRMEDALRESENKYKTLVENSLTGVFIHQNGRYIFVNDRFAEIHGYKPKELLGKEFIELLHPDERQEIALRVSKRLRDELHPTRYEVRRLKKDGKIVWGEMMATNIQYQGKPAIMGNLIDITERKQAEEALKQANEELLKAHNQRKILSKRLIDLLEKDRRQIAMELHDHIGQILTSCKIDLEIIHDRLEDSKSELRPQVKAIQEKALQIMKDVKNISYGLRPGMIDTLGIESSLRELFNEIMQNTNIKTNFFSRRVPKHFDNEKELAIYRIAQEALNNIIRHARAKNVFVNLSKKDDNLSLSVEDDGVGFIQDKAMKISGGKGPLGLLIMRERAEQLDGKFTIDSQPGKGTHMLVEIPL